MLYVGHKHSLRVGCRNHGRIMLLCHKPPPFLKHTAALQHKLPRYFHKSQSRLECFLSTNQNHRPVIGIRQSSMLVDFPNRLDEHEHDLCTNLTQKRRTVHFSLSTTLYYYPDVLEDKVASSWYTSEEQQRFKQMARQEMAWFIKMIEDSRYVGIRLKHGMSPVGIEQATISRSHSERRVI